MHNGTMSVLWPGSMRGSRVKRTLLLLFLLLLSAGTVLCQDEENDEAAEAGTDEDTSAVEPAEGDASTEPVPDDSETTAALEPPPTDEETIVDNTVVDSTEGSGPTEGSGDGETDPDVVSEEDQSLSPTIILIAVGLGMLIIAAIVGGIVISRRCNAKAKKRGLKEEDPYLDGSPGEKVPMPMFEEDVPSVLELEMEELDQWMQQDGEAAKESMRT
ncbi:transmembrane protein 154 isoform X1 [Takifugu flavidus]|uniref:transmembrane protein 154 isoform X1 n=1 Tax=Takifugu flavidus TaxID=433684 RepID=UPI0025440B95|nr:transmembrane protein 154 isoform X1 [Takifugu flavidus]